MGNALFVPKRLLGDVERGIEIPVPSLAFSRHLFATSTTSVAPPARLQSDVFSVRYNALEAQNATSDVEKWSKMAMFFCTYHVAFVVAYASLQLPESPAIAASQIASTVGVMLSLIGIASSAFCSPAKASAILPSTVGLSIVAAFPGLLGMMWASGGSAVHIAIVAGGVIGGSAVLGILLVLGLRFFMYAE